MEDSSRIITIPYIAGDGIGPEIMHAARPVIDAAVSEATDGSVVLRWVELTAGEAAFERTGQWLPVETVDAIRSSGVALKGPLTTPVGRGFRSLNVALRQALDLYASVRPVRYFDGVPSPVKDPEGMDIVIFRENTEDVYRGIEWRSGSPEAREVLDFMREKLNIEVPLDSGIGLKPMSERASKRLIRAAIEFALSSKRKSVTMVHKGNIMKFTEGAFRDWGYNLAACEYRDRVVFESELDGGGDVSGRLVLKDRIADNMFQQILTRPREYSVLAAPNLNGDYLADACAAQVGGLGLAPGANIGDSVAVFEPVHGSAPKYAGKDVANPAALMLSGAMMLEHMGLGRAGVMISKAIGEAYSEKTMTADLARLCEGSRCVGTKEFGRAVLSKLG